MDINSSGQVTGMGSNSYAYIYSNGTFTNLGGLGGFQSEGFGINDSGQVVGMAVKNNNARAFLYSGGTMVDLGDLGGNPIDGTRAWDINEAGHVAGAVTVAPFFVHPFLNVGGVMTDLTPGTAVYQGFGFAINNHDEITGSTKAYVPGANYRAFVYSDGVVTDIGTLGGEYSAGVSINDAGQVVGNSQTADGNSRAFYYFNGVMTELDTGIGSSSASDINNCGQIVGMSSFQNSLHPFLYSDGVTHDLNTLFANLLVGDALSVGFTHLDTAEAINDNGLVVGMGTYFDGSSYTNQGYILDTRILPGDDGHGHRAPDGASTIALMGFSLVGLVGLRRSMRM